MNLEEAIATRRSIRSYTDEPVSKEEILRLLEMAMQAPYASACWRFVVVQDPGRRKQLSEIARQDWIANVPVIVVVGADTQAFLDHQNVRWDAYKFRELFYIQDTAAAIQNLMLAATDMGLGTCWIGSFTEGGVSKAVKFPRNVRPVAMVTLGHPAEQPKEKTLKPLEECAFWETYGAKSP